MGYNVCVIAGTMMMREIKKLINAVSTEKNLDYNISLIDLLDYYRINDRDLIRFIVYYDILTLLI